jgi:hypothetical protein
MPTTFARRMKRLSLACGWRCSWGWSPLDERRSPQTAPLARGLCTHATRRPSTCRHERLCALCQHGSDQQSVRSHVQCFLLAARASYAHEPRPTARPALQGACPVTCAWTLEQRRLRSVTPAAARPRSALGRLARCSAKPLGATRARKGKCEGWRSGAAALKSACHVARSARAGASAALQGAGCAARKNRSAPPRTESRRGGGVPGAQRQERQASAAAAAGGGRRAQRRRGRHSNASGRPTARASGAAHPAAVCWTASAQPRRPAPASVI